jgi:hypothetical protein
MRKSTTKRTITLGYAETRILEDGDGRDAYELRQLIAQTAETMLTKHDRVEVYACARRGGYCVTQFPGMD